MNHQQTSLRNIFKPKLSLQIGLILIVLSVFVISFFNFTGNIIIEAQNSAEYKEAQNTISQVLGVQVLCQEPFLNAKAIQDCINLELGNFLPVIDVIDEGTKNQLTPLRDTTRSYPGILYNREELEILPIQIQPIISNKNGCQWNYMILKTVGKPLAKQYTITFETCGLDVSKNQLMEIKNGQALPKTSGNIPIRTPFVDVSLIVYLLS